MIDFEADLDEVMNPQEFATTATYALQNGTTGQIVGVLVNEGDETNLGRLACWPLNPCLL